MSESKGFPIFGPMLEEGLYDPHDAPQHSRWLPYNREAAELACCLEASKQIIELAPLLNTAQPSARAFTLMATPVFSLVEHTLNLYRLLAKKDRSKWPGNDQRNFVGVARSLKKRLKGPLRELRNKRSAHHDVDALHPATEVPIADADLLMLPLAEALIVLVLALNHRGTFGYYRLPDPSKPNEVQIMIEYPMATLLRLDERGKLAAILEFRIAADPRHESSAIIRRTIDVYNDVASRLRYPKIDLIPRDHPEGDVTRQMNVRIL